MRVTPRAGVDAIDGVDAAGHLRIRVRAAPDRGAANAALTRLVATALNVPPTSVSVRRGAAARHKLLAVEGVGAAAIRARWPGVSLSD